MIRFISAFCWRRRARNKEDLERSTKRKYWKKNIIDCNRNSHKAVEKVGEFVTVHINETLKYKLSKRCKGPITIIPKMDSVTSRLRRQHVILCSKSKRVIIMRARGDEKACST